ncbi:hypothetical protein B9D92_21830, partial [Mycobacterium tuberculosis]
MQVLDQFGEPLNDSAVSFTDDGEGNVTTDMDTGSPTGPSSRARSIPVDTGDRNNETNLSVQVLDQFGEPLNDSAVSFTDDGEGNVTTDMDT